ncbi:LINE-1 retrotransposable element ORF2 protein [Portunus trituberculatus]|uniref:LINE-1 retrotransposable element ORF2 protein n=1 Tax=Portunus trituberculatus TaxID=210409 RepID=A0A5B7FET1_PORTR|nr:LINE-1 retrotransposable element ORF2 protein [Portunus trituberculatus]
MPVLDDPITPQEVMDQVNNFKSNKACGPDGIPPDILKFLPPNWILTLSILFSNIFMTSAYPVSWVTAKLFPVFKRGSRPVVSNYRGISVINSIPKLYDMILSSRLSQWFTPHREQAGSQAGRGCLEHVVTLRLLCDIAKRKKFKLFVTFVDFSQAYDKVPHDVLFEVLKRLGCGITMLLDLAAVYMCTNSVIGTTVISAAIGVRQGSPTSCILFVIFVNDMIRLIKQNCDINGFLTWLHLLVLMDDTASVNE